MSFLPGAAKACFLSLFLLNGDSGWSIWEDLWTSGGNLGKVLSSSMCSSVSLWMVHVGIQSIIKSGQVSSLFWEVFHKKVVKILHMRSHPQLLQAGYFCNLVTCVRMAAAVRPVNYWVKHHCLFLLVSRDTMNFITVKILDNLEIRLRTSKK